LEDLFEPKKFDIATAKKIIEDLLNIKIDYLSEKQIKMLWNLYQENLRDGLKPKDAMSKAFEIITCFKV